MSDHPILLHWYEHDPADEALVISALRSGRLAHAGFTAQLESLVAIACGCTEGVAVSSAGLAMRLLARALDLGPGAEVIVSPLIAPPLAEAIHSTGARVVLADVEPVSLNLDPYGVESRITEKTRLIVFTHSFGNPTHIDRIERLARRHELMLIEDVTEGLGTRHADRPIGSFGRAAVVSLGAESIVNCGGGGVVVAEDARLVAGLRTLRSGRAPEHPAPVTGPIDAMSEVMAAVGIGQLRRLDAMRQRRSVLAETYMRRLMEIPALVVPTVDPATVMAWSGFVCRLDTTFTEHERNNLVRAMRLHDVEMAIPATSLHRRPGGDGLLGPGDRLPICDSVSERLIRLPFHLGLSLRDVDIVAHTLEVMISRENLSRG